MDTKPTIETVLERINELGVKLEARIDGVDTRLASLETRVGGLETRVGGLETRLVGLDNAVTGLRDEVHHGFHAIERRFEVMSGDMLKLRTDLRYMHDRLDKLEKVS